MGIVDVGSNRRGNVGVEVVEGRDEKEGGTSVVGFRRRSLHPRPCSQRP